ncbi:hypothetical protein HDU85_003121 [Gaertneriomyces sp. JEL0708]|nr:hypothetical protein HDU85_003121 [Gaertneriomyces sp. JEL0708]
MTAENCSGHRRALRVPADTKCPISFDHLTKLSDPVADIAFKAICNDERVVEDAYGALEVLLEKEELGELNADESQLLVEARTVPDWVDWDIVNHGREVYWKHVFAIQSVLLYGSLAGGFSIPRVNDVLLATGYLSHRRHINRRLLQTGKMVHDSMYHGLQPGSEGWRSVLRVRLLHASVRHRMSQRMAPLKNSEETVVINQADLIGTLLGFQASVVAGLTRMWTYMSPADRESYTHLWRYIGYLVGVDERYNPLQYGFDQTLAALREYLELYFLPDRTSSQLSTTLLSSLSEAPKNPTPYSLAVALSRRFLDGPLAEALNLPQPSLRYRAAAFLVFVFLWLTSLIVSVPGLKPTVIAGRKRRMEGMMNRMILNASHAQKEKAT